MVVNNKDKNKDKNFIGWQLAVREAKRQIAEAQIHIRQLRESVRICERKLRSGEPWPGEKQPQKEG
jgi:phage shock protein A